MNLFYEVKRRPLYAMLMASLILLSGCNKQGTDSQGAGTEWVNIAAKEVVFNDLGGTRNIPFELAGNVGSDLSVSVAGNGRNWCEASVDGNTITVTMTAQAIEHDRTTILTISNGSLQKSLAVTQYARTIESDDDREIAIASATASSEEEGFGIANTYDVLTDTYYMSAAGAALPVELEYTLEEPGDLSYAIYYPRTDDGDRDGSFGRFEAWIKSGSGEYVKVGEYNNAEHIQRACKINMPKGTTGVTAVKFVVLTGLNNRASASQVKFFESAEERMDLTDIFTDATYSELKPGITADEAGRMTDPFFRKIALGIIDGSYQTEFRVKDVRPYQNPTIKQTQNKTLSPYGLRDNATGIYVTQYEELMIYVGPTHGRTIGMVIQNLETNGHGGPSFTLTEGLNKIKAPSKGLVYLTYFVDEDIPLPVFMENATEQQKDFVRDNTIRVHFVNGTVNGYFDAMNPNHTQAFWVKLLKNAKSQDIDVMGRYFELTWNVSDFLAGKSGGNTPTEILQTVANLDSTLYWEWDFMGHTKYGTYPNNRHYLRVTYDGASPASAAYNTMYTRGSWTYYREVFCTPSTFSKRSWVLGHEIGHANQTHGLKWTAMTEVTNNIMSLYVHYMSNGKNPTPKNRGGGGLEDFKYPEALQYLTEEGDPFSVYGDGERDCRLVVFWQLYLYLHEICGIDFYPQFYQHLRVTPSYDTSDPDGVGYGLQQLNFVRQACVISNMNLLDFFRKRGFLVPVDKVVMNDYGNKGFSISQASIDALIAEIEAHNYPLPTRPSDGSVITDLHLLTDSNKNDYK